MTNTEDTLTCFIQFAMCGSVVRARVRNGDATTGRRGTFHPSTAHVTSSMGLMGPIFEFVMWSVVDFFIPFFCLFVAWIYISAICGAWFRVFVIGPHWRFVSGTGLRVRSLCLRSQVVRGSRFLSLIYTGDSGWVVCPVALFAIFKVVHGFEFLSFDFPF